MSESPLDLLKNRMKNSLSGAAVDVADAAVSEGTRLVKNAILGKLQGLANSGNRSGVVNNPAPAKEAIVDVNTDEDDEDEEFEDDEDEFDEDDELEDDEEPVARVREEGDVIPIAFDAFDKEKNLECAVAVFRLWGLRDNLCVNNEMPDIVAEHVPTGLAFVGTYDELENYCANYELDDKWIMHGLNAENVYDSSEIDSLKVKPDTTKYVTMFLKSKDTKEHKDSEKMFKDFHWDPNEKTARVVKTIPFMENIPLAMLGVAQAIIYTAQKDGEVQTFIHEFGEESGLKPVLYSLPTPDGEKHPRSVLIDGGKMRVEGRGLVD